MGFRYAIEGILSAIKSEVHLRFHIVIANLIAVFAYFYGISNVEWAILTLCIFLCIIIDVKKSAKKSILKLIINRISAYKIIKSLPYKMIIYLFA